MGERQAKTFRAAITSNDNATKRALESANRIARSKSLLHAAVTAIVELGRQFGYVDANDEFTHSRTGNIPIDYGVTHVGRSKHSVPRPWPSNARLQGLYSAAFDTGFGDRKC